MSSRKNCPRSGNPGERRLPTEHVRCRGLGDGVSTLNRHLILQPRRNVLLISEHPPASPSSLPHIQSPSSTTLDCVAGPGSFLDAVYIAAYARHNRALHDVSPASPLDRALQEMEPRSKLPLADSPD